MHRLAVLDFETTGLEAGTDEVLQAAVIDETGAVLMNEYFCPARHTEWPEAQKVNGISPRDVAGLPPFEQAAAHLREILESAETVIAYNDPFEKSFLDAYGIPARQLHWGEDPLTAFAQQTGGTRRTLSAAAGFFGIEFDAHNALGDVQATLELYSRVKDGGLLRTLLQDAPSAWGQTPNGPAAYKAPSQENILRILKCLGLCPFTAAQPRQLQYKGVYTTAPRPCECKGFQMRGGASGWLVVAVEAGGTTYLVCDDHLREMQAAAFGREGGTSAVRTGTKRAAKQQPQEEKPKRTGTQGGRFAAFARKSAAVKVEPNENADPANPFYGKAVVFTGDLSMPRGDAAEAVAALGASVKSAVSAKTDYLVVGAQDPSLVGASGRSGKEEKAQTLNESGKAKIEILDEAAFTALLARANGR